MKITITSKLGHYSKITYVLNPIHTCISSYFSLLIFQLSFSLQVGWPTMVGLHYICISCLFYSAKWPWSTIIRVTSCQLRHSLWRLVYFGSIHKMGSHFMGLRPTRAWAIKVEPDQNSTYNFYLPHVFWILVSHPTNFKK